MRRLRIGVAAWIAIACGCGPLEPRGRGGLPELLATSSVSAGHWLGEFARVHAEIDGLLDRKDLERARAILSRMAERRAPAGIPPEHRRIVQQDLFFRLAEVELGRGDPAAALAAAERGLAHGATPDVFGGNLRIVEGRALEALGRELEAVERYRLALEINEALLERALDDERKN